MLYIYALVALFIAWIWVDYYRLIDIYEKEDLKYFGLAFLLGCGSVYIVLGLHDLFIRDLGWRLNGHFLNDFLYCVIQIGVLEEFAKLIPFLIMLLFFRKEINEPIDYIAYMCVGALGFSAFENVKYFSSYGAEIINGRAILSSVGHMLFTALTAYGIVLFKYKRSQHGIKTLFLFFILASFAHGFYDFWLMYSGISTANGVVITILFFLFGISTFAQILNNALNNSNFFTHKVLINPIKVSRRLIFYYFIVFILQFIILSYQFNIEYAFNNIGLSFSIVALIVVITSLRMSRFKLIQNHWESLSIELPFRIVYRESIDNQKNRWMIRINGDSFDESAINSYFQEYFYLHPLNKYNPLAVKTKLAYIQKKVYLNNEEAIYIISLFDSDKNSNFDTLAIKAKRKGLIRTKSKHPIVAVMNILDYSKLDGDDISIRDFKFVEWASIKSVNE